MVQMCHTYVYVLQCKPPQTREYFTFKLQPIELDKGWGLLSLFFSFFHTIRRKIIRKPPHGFIDKPYNASRHPSHIVLAGDEALTDK